MLVDTGVKAGAQLGSAATSLPLATLPNKFLWMNMTFAWDRCVREFSYNIFYGFAASLVSLGYGIRYQLRKARAEREWGKLVTDYIELLFFFAGQSLGSALTSGVAYLVIPAPFIVAMTVWLPRMFIGRASGAAFQNFSRRFITRTAVSRVTKLDA